MAKVKTQWRCSKCGYTSTQWSGQCPSCEEWGSFVEDSAGTSNVTSRAAGVKSSAKASTPVEKAARTRDIEVTSHAHRPTGISEFDRVIGGGLVPGGVILMSGDPGTGKSTLTNDIAHRVGEQGFTSLIISSEESQQQIALRTQRIGATSDNLFIASEVELSKVLGHIEEVNPDFLVIDSLQTMASGEIDARTGSPSQVTEVATVLTRIAKERKMPMILICQVTKDGNIAGPKVVEHLVDIVVHFEGDRDSSLRMLRGVKNRYGAADEVGCFEHTETGIVEVPDPSGLLLGRREEAVPGVATAIIIQGRRPLPIEIQALVAGSQLPVPRRAVSGLDSPQTVMVQAIAERHGQVRLADKDIYVSTIGGIRTKEPSIALATALALASSALDFSIPLDVVIIGEVTLSGEVRNVPGVERRLKEAVRLGFTRAIVPQGSYQRVEGMQIIKASHMGEALAKARQL